MAVKEPTLVFVPGSQGGALPEHLSAAGFDCQVVARDAVETARGAAVFVVDLRGGEADARELLATLREGQGEDVSVLALVDSADTLAPCVELIDDFAAAPTNAEVEVRLRAMERDREERSELESVATKLRELQKMKRELATLVVHDLRNPLTALLGNIQLLASELDANREVQGMLGDMDALASKALSMANTLLDVEELEEGIIRVRPVEICGAQFARQISKHQRAVIEARELTLDFELQEDCYGYLDAQLIGRVLENLLDNAVRYAPRHGRVVVRARNEEGKLVFQVGNNGPPVPDSERDQIFGRYYRLEERRAGARANRGLGLYFCQLAVQAHGGRISVDEDGELGAVFTVRLPRRAQTVG